MLILKVISSTKHRQVLKTEYRKVLEAFFIGFGSAFRFFVGGGNHDE
jgi:hypothetical protein